MLLALTKRRVNSLALAIYNNAVVWWELSESGAPYADSVGLSAQYRLTADFGITGITPSQATLRSGGSASILFTAANRGLYTASPVPGTITQVAGAMDHTMVYWYNPTSIGQGYASCQLDPVFLNDTFNGQFGTHLDSSGHPSSNWWYSASNLQQTTSSTLVVSIGTTYFLGYSKRTSSLAVDHYANGLPQNTASYVHEPTDGSQSRPSVGQVYTETTNGLRGYLQGLALFKIALTAAEHAYLYNGGVGKSWAQVKAEAGF